jgi:hypothetical protein
VRFQSAVKQACSLLHRAVSFLLNYYFDMKMTNFALLPNLLLVCAFVFLTGCGGGNVLKTNRVEGIVTYNGTPLANATVTFYPEGGDATPAFGKTNENGKYLLQTQQGAIDAGTTPGEYIVTVSKKEYVPTGRKMRGGDNYDEMVDEMTLKETLPVKYSDKPTSPFKATVENKKVNTFDFKLDD